MDLFTPAFPSARLSTLAGSEADRGTLPCAPSVAPASDFLPPPSPSLSHFWLSLWMIPGRSSRNISRNCPSISCWRYLARTVTESKVELTVTLSSGSFLNTSVIPFALLTMRTMMARNRKCESCSFIGTTSGEAANRMPRLGAEGTCAGPPSAAGPSPPAADTDASLTFIAADPAAAP